MRDFLIRNRATLIERCTAKVAQRPYRAATLEQLKNGIPLFLDQLARTLAADTAGQTAESVRISGEYGSGSLNAASEMGLSAALHGKQLLGLGYTVDQVVHDYSDLCQAVSDMAVERNAAFAVEEFRTLNRCLDNAIAEAVTEFSSELATTAAKQYADEANARQGFLLHELRNSLHTANLALTALETGKLPIGGATGTVLRRSLVALSSLVKNALNEVRVAAFSDERKVFALAPFLADAGSAALLDANARGCIFVVTNTIDPDIEVEGDRELLLGAVMNLVQNAFKFTRPGTEVFLNARPASDGTVCIDVRDGCGGLPAGFEEVMFSPFTRRHADRSGLGLGLAIARQSVQAVGGTLTVRDMPGRGCVFTISLRRSDVPSKSEAPAN